MSPDLQPRGRFRSFLWRRKWIVVLAVAVTAAGAFGASFGVAERYRSEATILVVPQQVPENYVRSAVTLRLPDRLASIQQQIMTRTRLEDIIEELNLYPIERKSDIMENVVQRMRRDLRAEPIREDAFHVSYDGDNPRTVQKVAEKLARSFIFESVADRERLTEGTNQFLEGQVDLLARRLVEQEKKINNARSQNGGRVPTILALDYELLQAEYRSLFAKKEESNTSANLERRQIGEQFRLLDPARVPQRPISPNRGQWAIYGALAGLPLGLIIVLVMFNRRRPAVAG